MPDWPNPTVKKDTSGSSSFWRTHKDGGGGVKIVVASRWPGCEMVVVVVVLARCCTRASERVNVSTATFGVGTRYWLSTTNTAIAPRLSADKSDTLTNSTRYGRRTPGVYTDPTSYDGTKLRVVGSTDFAGGPPLHENEPKMATVNNPILNINSSRCFMNLFKKIMLTVSIRNR